MEKHKSISYIENHTWSTTRLGLDRTRELLNRVGNPQDRLKFIHVAGSNGKGSTCAMLASVLKESGYVTGLYTSPYLVDFREQLQVNNDCISLEELDEIVDIVRPQAEAMSDHPSRFELLTTVAMIYFLRKKCDIVVLEVGMGGALDSTNIIPPAVLSVIMNIGLEHSEYLGDNIEEIAATKAGIIKPGTHCVCYNGDARATQAVRNRCIETDVEFNLSDFDSLRIEKMGVEGVTFSDDSHSHIYIPLAGIHQMYNAKVVLDCVDILRKQKYSISEQNLRDGLKKVEWPARFQILRRGPLFILDGAHNPQCVEALSLAIKDNCPDIKFVFLMGVLEDKDYMSILDMMLPFAEKCICVTPDSPRALKAEKLQEAIGGRVEACAYDSLEKGLELALLSDRPVLAFGSLYMAGQLLSMKDKYFCNCSR